MRSYEIEAQELLEDRNPLAAGLFAIAAALGNVAVQLKYLGNGDGVSPSGVAMGAIELLGTHLGEKIQEAGNSVAAALGEIAMNVERDE